jgi:hypothetical protein
MTTQQFQLDMTLMLATHAALRRDVERAARLTNRTEGWDLFERILHVHHTAEDDALWPVVREAVAGRPDDLALLDEMAAEHAAIEPLLSAIDEAFDSDGSGAQLGELVGVLGSELRDHLDHEERDALPVIDRSVTLEQWMAFGQASAQALGPDVARYFPWILEGADDAMLDRVLSPLPEPLQTACRNEWIPAYEAKDLWSSHP